MAFEQRPPSDGSAQTIAAAVTEISDRATLLIREEIELAKAEVTEKVTKLIKGAVVAIVAGVFAVLGLIFLLHGLSWLLAEYLFSRATWGFLVVAGMLFVLGAIAGFVAVRWLRFGAPPTPEMAIDEAQRIRATFTGEPGGALEAAAARAEAGLSPGEVERSRPERP
ncbi:MAG: phage holin family protein [Solirubrobacteraceae bacterium]|jgi:uncharacterized membrane protein YqjE